MRKKTIFSDPYKITFQQPTQKYYIVTTNSGVVAADFDINTDLDKLGLIVVQDQGSSSNVQYY